MNIQNASAAAFDQRRSDMFRVRGKLTELQTSRTTVNLLEKIQKRPREKSFAVGLAAAVPEMHGVVANAAMLTFYDGDDSHNFACLIEGQVVCGTFDNADQFRDGDQVEAIVSQRGTPCVYTACSELEISSSACRSSYLPGKGRSSKVACALPGDSVCLHGSF